MISTKGRVTTSLGNAGMIFTDADETAGTGVRLKKSGKKLISKNGNVGFCVVDSPLTYWEMPFFVIRIGIIEKAAIKQ